MAPKGVGPIAAMVVFRMDLGLEEDSVDADFDASLREGRL